LDSPPADQTWRRLLVAPKQTKPYGKQSMPSSHETDHSIAFPVLIGDIGGTNARFAILTDAYAEPKEFPVLATADYPTIDEAIQTGVLDRTSLQPRSAILAVGRPDQGR
jgi:glucokinase